MSLSDLYRWLFSDWTHAVAALGGSPLIVFGTNRPVAKVKFRIASAVGGTVRINGAGAP